MTCADEAEPVLPLHTYDRWSLANVGRCPVDILDEIGNEQRGRRFAIIIDEAHSSQGGRTAGAMSQAFSKAGEADEEETFEDQINRLMESRKLLPGRCMKPKP